MYTEMSPKIFTIFYHFLSLYFSHFFVEHVYIFKSTLYYFCLNFYEKNWNAGKSWYKVQYSFTLPQIWINLLCSCEHENIFCRNCKKTCLHWRIGGGKIVGFLGFFWISILWSPRISHTSTKLSRTELNVFINMNSREKINISSWDDIKFIE